MLSSDDLSCLVWNIENIHSQQTIVNKSKDAKLADLSDVITSAAFSTLNSNICYTTSSAGYADIYDIRECSTRSSSSIRLKSD